MSRPRYSRDYPGECVEKAGARWWVVGTARAVLPHKVGRLVLLSGPDPEHDLEAFCGGMGWSPDRVTLVDSDPSTRSAMERAQARWPGVRAVVGDVGEELDRGDATMLAYLDFMGLGEAMIAPIEAAVGKLPVGGVVAVTWYCSREFPGHLSHRVRWEYGRGDRTRGFDHLMRLIADVVWSRELKFLGSHSYRRARSPMTVGAWQRVR